MASTKAYDVAVIGAGVFGAWTALTLARTGRSVVLLDAYGPGNARASSGGESRLIRMAYGPDELFTRWSARSLVLWKELFRQTGQPLFVPAGILWMITEQDAYTRAARETLTRLHIPHQWLSRADMENRWPQIALGRAEWGLFEPESGVLLARRAVADTVEAAVAHHVEYIQEAAIAPIGSGRVEKITTQGGDEISAGEFVFACGRGSEKYFQNCSAIKFLSRARKFFILACRLKMRASVPMRFPDGSTSPTSGTECPTSNLADSKLHSIATARRSIRIPVSASPLRNRSRRRAHILPNDFPRSPAHHFWKRGSASTKILPTEIFSSIVIPISKMYGSSAAARATDSNTAPRWANMSRAVSRVACRWNRDLHSPQN